MDFKSNKGYSLLEIGVGLVIITIFMIYSISMIRATFTTYSAIEQKNIALSYLIKGTERELLDNDDLNITSNPLNTVVTEDSVFRKVTVTTISTNNMTLTTVVEPLPSRNGVSYVNKDIRIVTSTVEYYLKKGDPSSRRELVLKTLKIGGDDANA